MPMFKATIEVLLDIKSGDAGDAHDVIVETLRQLLRAHAAFRAPLIDWRYAPGFVMPEPSTGEGFEPATAEWPTTTEASDRRRRLATRGTPIRTLVVVVDNVHKGEVFQRNNRWHWRRGDVAVEPFPKGSTLDDVAEWARKCCNGKAAHVARIPAKVRR